jgi:hypothetical protein
MKKFIAIAAVAVSLTACNTGASTEATTTTDSTAVITDTTKVVADTTKAVDTVKAAK